MSESQTQHPIINSPYLEPAEHWKIDPIEPAEKMPGRRPATYIYMPPGASANSDEGKQETLPLVELLRNRVAEWRAQALRGEGGVSRITMDLLNYWWREGRQHRLFFAQLEAAETVIFLTEARDDLRQGINLPLDQPSEDKLEQGFTAFERRCCRMATGAGKTTVMAMLAAWSILNKVNNPRDPRYSDAVLIVCPNITIRDRLRELDPGLRDASIYWTRDLVPPAMRSQLTNGKVLTTNWHVFEPRNPQSGNRVVKTGQRRVTRETITIGPQNTTARGKRYMTEQHLRTQSALNLIKILEEKRDKQGNLTSVEVESEKYIESDTALVRRVLGKDLGDRSNLLVFNDEAHHAYRLHWDKDTEDATDDILGEKDMTQYYYKEATVWVEGLDCVHKQRGIHLCVDFSATPYFLGKAGENTNRIFPWTVSSFDLQDAIEAGLVKIPQLVARDPSGNKIPSYFNIWKWILPQLTPAERGGKKSNAKPEAVLKYAHTPMAIIGGMWQKWLRKMKNSDDKRPPVFIIVCKTKNLANLVYEWLAEDKPPSASISPAGLEELRNTATEENTICVYSDMEYDTEGSGAKADETRWMRYTLDTIGKLSWPLDEQGGEHPPQAFDDLADKLGRPRHPPGRDVRCIVSVGMLTEGWDCNTVTHIIGLRPFMSQLLCEQVVGRGLRRASYEVGEDGLMTEEIATVFGVPLSAFTVKRGDPPSPPKKRNHIRALPERKDFEITFPRVEGYRHIVRHRIICDMDNMTSLKIEYGKIPPEVEMKAGLPDNEGRLSLYGPGKASTANLDAFRKEKRLQQRIWEMAAALTKHYLKDEQCLLPPDAAFNQLLNIVQIYISEKVEVTSPADRLDAFLSPYYGFIIERLLDGIRPDTESGESPELPRYESNRGDGSTAEVDFWTSRDVYPIYKSHLNAVVADTEKLEQATAYKLDNHAVVLSFVKNDHLGFAMPYMHNDQMHEYLPDFIIRLKDNSHLILETKGFDNLKEIKEKAANRWVDAVNADKKYGVWKFAMVSNVDEAQKVLDEIAGEIGG